MLTAESANEQNENAGARDDGGVLAGLEPTRRRMSALVPLRYLRGSSRVVPRVSRASKNSKSPRELASRGSAFHNCGFCQAEPLDVFYACESG